LGTNDVGFPSHSTSDWIRVENEIYTGAVSGSDTITRVRYRRHGFVPNTATDSTPGLVRLYDGALRYNGWMAENYFGNGFNGESSVCRHDDHYVQHGSLARFELTNSATWGAETVAEIQPASSWADGSVSLTLNLGSQSTASGLYLWHLGNTGTASLVGRFV
jgi:hypothetical protein